MRTLDRIKQNWVVTILVMALSFGCGWIAGGAPTEPTPTPTPMPELVVVTPTPRVVETTVAPTLTAEPVVVSADECYIEALNECGMESMPKLLRDLGAAASEQDVSTLCSLSHEFEAEVEGLLIRWNALPQPVDEHLQNSRRFLGKALEAFSLSAEALRSFCESNDVDLALTFLALAAEYMEQGSDYLNQAAEELEQYSP